MVHLGIRMLEEETDLDAESELYMYKFQILEEDKVLSNVVKIVKYCPLLAIPRFPFRNAPSSLSGFNTRLKIKKRLRGFFIGKEIKVSG